MYIYNAKRKGMQIKKTSMQIKKTSMQTQKTSMQTKKTSMQTIVAKIQAGYMPSLFDMLKDIIYFHYYFLVANISRLLLFFPFWSCRIYYSA
jgi:hypothetical protein